MRDLLALAVTCSTKRVLQALGGPVRGPGGRRLEVLHNAADTSVFTPSDSPAETMTLLLTGSHQQWYRTTLRFGRSRSCARAAVTFA